MSPDQFKMQMNRVEETWGHKHFEAERLELIWNAVAWMGLGEFAKIVDHLIATSRYAPLPKDFIEAARVERSRSFQNTVKGAADSMNAQWAGSLQNVLEKQYPGAKSVNEAIEIERLKIKVRKAFNESK